jgi:Flp pilus assembly protein TadD
LLYNNVALPLIVADDQREARDLLQLAWRSAGDNPPIELTAILENLARLEPDSAECERQLRDAFSRKQEALGAMHPDVLSRN